MLPSWLRQDLKSKEVISGCVQKFIACEDCCRCIQLLMEISQLVERNFSCLISIDGACMLRKEQVILQSSAACGINADQRIKAAVKAGK